ncbi:hypothetical protein J8281_07590 [Aquimarina sp. U1-2]|uniref:hypothetical protein n=1 Tax=Aquimarina sp. U1-2 TaxID=2823141 RepID=UPI001AECD6E7|nr:hypothetical protein [Aquimarina sp. U1-2]MBP2832051.1 hypothetical protein [Aquimarina sp. U1-2]
MKTATVRELKTELTHRCDKELIDICIQLSKFKKENKELLTYILFESSSEAGYVESIKSEVDQQFALINTSSYHYIKKSVRKILRLVKKYIRYSKNKETEVELLLYFCQKLSGFQPFIKRSTVLQTILDRETKSIYKKLNGLHEDLQYDFKIELESL